MRTNQRPYLRKRIKQGCVSKSDLGPTSVTPIHGYPMGRHSLSSATVRYSESGRHAGRGQLLAKAVRGKSARCKCPKRRYIRLLMPILDLPGNRCLTGDRGLDLTRGEKERTKVHDMVATDGTIVDDDVCPCVRLARIAGLSMRTPCP